MSEAKTNVPEYTVSEFSGYLKGMVENTFGALRLRGEVSGYRGPASSGHVYFSLKDAQAKIDAVIWKGVFLKLKTRPEEGMEVIVSGRATIFPGKSSYQIIIDAIMPAGAGALAALLEARKKKLLAEGLFDESRKKLLPYLPRVIGIVTSPTGAVIRDVLHRLRDRFPCRVIVWPVPVQGQNSGAAVAAAINGFNALSENIPRPDVLIVARGGGSLEDLWGFNDEHVVRAAAASEIPLISAIGHETDWTLLDLAADFRAPTPSAAAEKAVPVSSELLRRVRGLGVRLLNGIFRLLKLKRVNVARDAKIFQNRKAERWLLIPSQRLDMARLSALRAFSAFLARRRGGFERLSGSLMNQSPRMRFTRIQDCLVALRKRLSRTRVQGGMMTQTRFSNVSRTLTRAFLSRIDLIRRERVRARERAHACGVLLRKRMELCLDSRRKNLEKNGALLRSLSYKRTIERGFALLVDEEGRPIHAVKTVPPGANIGIRVKDGMINAKVTAVSLDDAADLLNAQSE